MPENPITTTTRTTSMSGFGTLTLGDLRTFVSATEETEWEGGARVTVTTTAARDQRDTATWEIKLVETTLSGTARAGTGGR